MHCAVDLVSGSSQRNIMHDKTCLIFAVLFGSFLVWQNKYNICHVTRYHTIKECKGSADEALCHYNKMLSDWPNDVAALGYGYIGARNNTTQQSGQAPDKEVEIKNITVYVSGYTETDMSGMLSPLTVWRQQSEFVSSRQSGQILAAVCIGFECHWNGQNGCQFKCSHMFLQCIPRQMLVCCVVSVLSPV